MVQKGSQRAPILPSTTAASPQLLSHHHRGAKAHSHKMVLTPLTHAFSQSKKSPYCPRCSLETVAGHYNRSFSLAVLSLTLNGSSANATDPSHHQINHPKQPLTSITHKHEQHVPLMLPSYPNPPRIENHIQTFITTTPHDRKPKTRDITKRSALQLPTILIPSGHGSSQGTSFTARSADPPTELPARTPLPLLPSPQTTIAPWTLESAPTTHAAPTTTILIPIIHIPTPHINP
mmetsp:Transcript_19009/g.38739  ORF Transcript_19009/g.38739 Transcript_19009/m.38739 type:complete len:234 (-) Transcript_19009:74-775(-)